MLRIETQNDGCVPFNLQNRRGPFLPGLIEKLPGDQIIGTRHATGYAVFGAGDQLLHSCGLGAKIVGVQAPLKGSSEKVETNSCVLQT